MRKSQKPPLPPPSKLSSLTKKTKQQAQSQGGTTGGAAKVGHRQHPSQGMSPLRRSVSQFSLKEREMMERHRAKSQQTPKPSTGLSILTPRQVPQVSQLKSPRSIAHKNRKYRSNLMQFVALNNGLPHLIPAKAIKAMIMSLIESQDDILYPGVMIVKMWNGSAVLHWKNRDNITKLLKTIGSLGATGRIHYCVKNDDTKHCFLMKITRTSGEALETAVLETIADILVSNFLYKIYNVPAVVEYGPFHIEIGDWGMRQQLRQETSQKGGGGGAVPQKKGS